METGLEVIPRMLVGEYCGAMEFVRAALFKPGRLVCPELVSSADDTGRGRYARNCWEPLGILNFHS
jgi:hypothetical protein